MTKRLDTLTALEESQAEEAAGQPLTILEDDTAPKVKMFCALAWVHMKRSQPELTFAEYLKTHRFRDAIGYVFGSDEEPAAESEAGEADPFPEGGEAPPAAAADGVADAEGPVLPRDGDLPG